MASLQKGTATVTLHDGTVETFKNVIITHEGSRGNVTRLVINTGNAVVASYRSDQVLYARWSPNAEPSDG